MSNESPEDCSWQEVYKLNGVIWTSEDETQSTDLDEIDTLVVQFSSPLKSLVKFNVPELILER